MTAKPEYRNRNYLALENASKPEAVYPCVRRGCVQLTDVADSNIQKLVATPCAVEATPPFAGKPKVVAAVGTWVLESRCGAARDYIGGSSYYSSEAAAAKASVAWAAAGGGRYSVIRPLAEGEQINY